MSRIKKYVLAAMMYGLFLSVHLQAVVPLPGYGAKNQATAGVGVALPQDTFVMIYNPAGIAFLDDSYDVGLSYLKLNDRVKVKNNELIPSDRFISRPDVFVPGAGIKRDYNCKLSWGVVAYGRGAGVNYGRSFPIFGQSKFKFDYKHYLLKPCLTWKINENQAIGIGVNLAVGALINNGTENLIATSIDPDHVTNKHHDHKLGAGVHIGWMGQFFNCLRLGVSYETKIYMQKFDKYRGLIAEKGKADGPSIISLGLSYDFACRWTIGFDYQRIYWDQLRYLSNTLNLVEPGGSKNGTGGGWHNEDRYKIGLIYKATDNLTLRLGYAYFTPLFRDSQIINNLNSFVVPTNYLSGGFSWRWNCSEISVAYTQSLNRTMKGDIDRRLGGGKIKIESTIPMLAVYFNQYF